MDAARCSQMKRAFESNHQVDLEKAVVGHVERHGLSNFKLLESRLNVSASRLKDLWLNKWSPCLSRAPWTADEDAELRRLYAISGNFATVSLFLPGRSQLHCRQRFDRIGPLVRKRAPVMTKVTLFDGPLGIAASPNPTDTVVATVVGTSNTNTATVPPSGINIEKKMRRFTLGAGGGTKNNFGPLNQQLLGEHA